MDLKKKFGEGFYNDLIKCDFLKDIEEMINYQGLINIDIDDFEFVSKGAIIIGAVSNSFDDINEEFKYIKINHKFKATDCILNVVGRKDVELSDIENIIKKLRSIENDINLIYGFTLDENLKTKFKVQALFTYHKDSNSKEAKTSKEENNKIEDTKLNDNLYDNKLLYDVALFFLDGNTPSVNVTQNEFGLGFNRASIIINKLVELGIISKKNGTNPRKLLINDKQKIEELIFKTK